MPRPMSTLVGKSKQFDPKCLACHTVRFEQPEGFNMKQQQMELVNVQCESCHGSAKEHLSDMTKKPAPKPVMALCIKCHTADRCPGFDLDRQEDGDDQASDGQIIGRSLFRQAGSYSCLPEHFSPSNPPHSHPPRYAMTNASLRSPSFDSECGMGASLPRIPAA